MFLYFWVRSVEVMIYLDLETETIKNTNYFIKWNDFYYKIHTYFYQLLFSL